MGRATEKVSTFLECTQVILKRALVNSIPVRSQMGLGTCYWTWRKGRPCCKEAENLAELYLCPSTLWQTELETDESGCLVEAVSKQWKASPVLSPRGFHGQRSLAGYSLQGRRVRLN